MWTECWEYQRGTSRGERGASIASYTHLLSDCCMLFVSENRSSMESQKTMNTDHLMSLIQIK